MMLPRKTAQLRSGREVEPVAVTLRDAAELLGISVTTLRDKLIAPVGGPPLIASVKLGGCRVIAVDELKRWAAEATEAARPQPVGVVSLTTTEPDADDLDLPVAVLRALGRTTKRPRLHALPRSTSATDVA